MGGYISNLVSGSSRGRDQLSTFFDWFTAIDFVGLNYPSDCDPYTLRTFVLHLHFLHYLETRLLVRPVYRFLHAIAQNTRNHARATTVIKLGGPSAEGVPPPQKFF